MPLNNFPQRVSASPNLLRRFSSKVLAGRRLALGCRWAVVFAVLVTLSTVRADGGDELDSQIDKRMAALKALLAAEATPESVRAFVDEHYRPGASTANEGRTVKYMEQFFRLFHGATLNPKKGEDDRWSRSFNATGAAAGEPAHFKIFFVKEPPHFIRGLQDTAPLQTAPGVVSDGMTDAEIAKAISKLAQENASMGDFSGALAVSNGSETIVSAAHGMANRRYGVANKVTTRFNMASMSKMFTAVGVCQLIQRGLVKPNDTLAMHVPEVAETYQGKATIHQLLTHTAGTGKMFGLEELSLHRHWIRTVPEITEILIKEEKLLEPGVRFEYSNSGFIWLGRLIEEVSGQDFYAYMDQHVFEPAGMNRTGYYELDKSVPDIAVGYTHVKAWGDQPGDPKRENTLLLGARGGPAGGGYSTVGDMLKFAEALRHHTLLDAKHTAMMLEPKVTARGSTQYAYGFQIMGSKLGHMGGFNGVGCEFWFYPETGYALVLFSNQDSGATPISITAQEMIERRK